MYKMTIIFCVLFTIVLIIFGLQFGRDVSVVSTQIESFDGGYIERVDIIANKLFIVDKEKFAKNLIKRCRKNNFKKVVFSYDINGFPNELHLTIYNNKYQRKHGESTFQVTYEQRSGEKFAYDIKNDPDKFRLKITN